MPTLLNQNKKRKWKRTAGVVWTVIALLFARQTSSVPYSKSAIPLQASDRGLELTQSYFSLKQFPRFDTLGWTKKEKLRKKYIWKVSLRSVREISRYLLEESLANQYYSYSRKYAERLLAELGAPLQERQVATWDKEQKILNLFRRDIIKIPIKPLVQYVSGTCQPELTKLYEVSCNGWQHSCLCYFSAVSGLPCRHFLQYEKDAVGGIFLQIRHYSGGIGIRWIFGEFHEADEIDLPCDAPQGSPKNKVAVSNCFLELFRPG